MNEKATLVVTAKPKPDEMESVQLYLQSVMPLFNDAGGKLVKRLKVSEMILGNPSGMVLVMDFDSDERIKSIFESDEYTALISVRDKGFAEMNILITHDL